MEYKEKLNKIIKKAFNGKNPEDCPPEKQKPLLSMMKKILFVDDDQILRDMYKMKFEKNGYEVKAVSSGPEALKLLRGGFVPDIFITDLMIPMMDGFSIFEAIKKENLAPNVIAIMLTNKGLSEEINKASSLGFNGYIVKATTVPAEVVEEVKKICKENCD